MATITYQDGTKINFNGTPTPKDIEEAYAQVKGKSAKKQPNIYDRIVSGARGVGNLLGGNQLGESIGTLGGYGYTKAKDLVTGSNNAQYYDLTAPTGKQIIGDSLKVGTSIIPTTKLGSAATGLASKIPVLSKVSRGLGATAEAGLVGYGQDVGQNLINKKENFTEAGLGTGIGLATPAALKAVGVLVGKPVGAIVNQFNPDAKTALFKSLKPSVKLKETRSLDINDFTKKPNDYTIIDVRNKSEVEAGKVFDNAISMPLNTIRDTVGKIPSDKPIVVHCAGGYRSAAGSSIIEKHLKNAKVYDLGEKVSDFQ